VVSKRVLITGLSTIWGGRLAQALERDPQVETVIGVDKRPPKVELERTEYVRVADQHSLIRRIVQAAQIDTVVDTRLVVDSLVTSPRLAHENNVIGTMNVLAACGGPDTTVKRLIVKSSAHLYGSEQDDPAFFTEQMRRKHPARTPIERDIVEAEAAIEDFSRRQPDVSVSLLRFGFGLGPSLRTAYTALLDLPAIPTILGFDPRVQFIHEDDIVGCLEHAVRSDLDGVYNCAADGVLVLSEVIDLLGKRNLLVLPPVATGLAVTALRRAGIRITPEQLNHLRFGRGLDNRRLKATGYRYRYTTRETILKLREHQRLAPLMGTTPDAYRYEADVEEFLRFSPSVQASVTTQAGGAGYRPSSQQLAELSKLIVSLQDEEVGLHNVAPRGGNGGPERYDELPARELIALLSSMERADLEALREHEAVAAGRVTVLRAIDALLAAEQAAG
jgi:UDP-glucose 4-epimerase